MSATRYPQKIESVHVESIDGELCVYDIARQRVHALNHTAAFVWQRCDGRTAPAELAAALSAEASVNDAEAVVQLTLQELAAAQLLAGPIDEVAPVSRRDLLRRGIAAAAHPGDLLDRRAVSCGRAVAAAEAAPTLTSMSPNQGTPGTTVAVTVTGIGFGATVAVSGTGVTASNVMEISATSLPVTFTIAAKATSGPRNVTVTTAGGTSNAVPFTVSALPPPEAPTLTSVSPNQGIRGETIAVTLTGTNFVVGATTVNVSADVTVANVAVTSSTSLTASFVLDLVPVGGARTVTVTTAGGISGAQPFTITLPLPGSMTFTPTGEEQIFLVPAGVVSILILAEGGPGGNSVLAANGGDGGRTVARVSVAPGTQLTVRVGRGGQFGTPTQLAAGGFNGGGSSTGNGGGGGGGASSVRNFDTDTPLVIAGGGGGGGGASGNALGGNGGGLIAEPGIPTPLVPEGGDPGGGGTQFAGGAGGTGKGSAAQSGTAGMAGSGGIGGNDGSGGGGGGGGGGGYFGGGGGGGGTPGGGGGGGGSSFTAPGATDVLHMQGCCLTGRVIIFW